MTDTAPAPEAAPTPPTSPVGIPRIGVTPTTTPEPKQPAPRSSTLLVDAAPRRTHRAEDLLDLGLAVLGIASLVVLSIYASSTTRAVTNDVQNVLTGVLGRILVLPIQTIEGLVTFVVPMAVLIECLLRRSWRSAGESAAAAAIGFASGNLVLRMINTWGPDSLVRGLTVAVSGHSRVGISVIFSGLAALLTMAGERRSSPVVRYSWVALWTITTLSVLRGAIPLAGVLISVLLGRGIGLALRYVFGVRDERAFGIAFIRALRRAGIDAARVVRLDVAPDVQAWRVTTQSPLGYTEQVREAPLIIPRATPEEPLGPGAQDDSPRPDEDGQDAAGDTESTEPAETIVPDPQVDLDAVLTEASSTALSQEALSDHRLYAVWDTSGIRRDVTVLDADRQVAGFVSTLWDRMRIRGLAPSSRDMSVRSAAEHTALMTLSARRANVRVPGLTGMAESGESMLMVSDHIVGARPLGEVTPTSGLLDDLWEQVRRAHAAGLAHRAIDATSTVVDVSGRVWLLDWEDGETISSELSRRMDLAQTLALTASVAGVEEAIASASRALTTAQVASIAPMLQAVVLPRSTREAMGRRGTLLQELRDALVTLTPTAHAEPAKVQRFSPRTVIMAVIGMVAIWTLLARMNFEQVSAAVQDANLWWILGALVFSLATYLGAGLALVAFSPVRLSVWRCTEVHLASSVVSLVAPAGMGGAAVNLRYLNRQGVSTAIGVATVALVQVVQFAVTAILLVVVAAATGQSATLSLPSGWIMVSAVVLVAVAGVVGLVPRLRSWVWSKLEPTYRQVWPRLVWVLTNPARLVVGIGGTMLLTAFYILSFAASLWAFGYTLPFSVLAITYLASNTVGSVVPSPGGIGPVEVALTAGLVAAGIPSGVALSTAIVYRVVTFWIPIPAGWLSLQRLQKAGDL